MSGLLLLIVFAAFMFFMHRGGGHGAMGGGGMGCCGGGSMHGSHNHEMDHQHKYNRKPDLTSVKEAEFEVISEEPENEIEAPKPNEYIDIKPLNIRTHEH